MVFQDEILLSTIRHGQMHDITAEVAEKAALSGIRSGIVHLFNVGSTAVIGTVEFEPGLEKDIPESLDRLIPPDGNYGHEMTWHDGNGHSHVQATLMGPSLTVPLRNGSLVLGTWQQIFHLECDIKPRNRTIMVTIHGE